MEAGGREADKFYFTIYFVSDVLEKWQFNVLPTRSNCCINLDIHLLCAESFEIFLKWRWIIWLFLKLLIFTLNREKLHLPFKTILKLAFTIQKEEGKYYKVYQYCLIFPNHLDLFASWESVFNGALEARHCSDVYDDSFDCCSRDYGCVLLVISSKSNQCIEKGEIGINP